jgi:hypothetical protein
VEQRAVRLAAAVEAAVAAGSSPRETTRELAEQELRCRCEAVALALLALHLATTPHAAAAAYGDEKNANRDIRVWHGATEKGP